jgi:hypothetical protein
MDSEERSNRSRIFQEEGSVARPSFSEAAPEGERWPGWSKGRRASEAPMAAIYGDGSSCAPAGGGEGFLASNLHIIPGWICSNLGVSTCQSNRAINSTTVATKPCGLGLGHAAAPQTHNVAGLRAINLARFSPPAACQAKTRCLFCLRERKSGIACGCARSLRLILRARPLRRRQRTHTFSKTAHRSLPSGMRQYQRRCPALSPRSAQAGECKW